MGGMFAGIMGGYTGAAEEQNRKLMEIEIDARKGLVEMYQTVLENPNLPQEMQQKLMEFMIQIPQLPLDKKMPKQFTDWSPGGELMKVRQQIRPPALPAPGNIPAQEGDLPPLTGAPSSFERTPGESQLMEAETSRAQTATQINAAQKWLQAGIKPPGVERDIQDPILLPPGTQAYQRDPSGEITGEPPLQAPFRPFKPDAVPQLSAVDQLAISAYAVRNGLTPDQLGATDMQKAIKEGKNMMRAPDKDRTIPVITIGPNGEAITYYTSESNVLGKSFARPGGAEGQAAQALQSAKLIFPRMKQLALGMKMGEWEEPKEERGIFTVEGWQALPSGLYKSLAGRANINVDMAEYASSLEGFIPIFARAVGHTGVLTEQDSVKTMKLFPRPGDSRALAIRKMRNIELLMAGEARLDPDWWDPAGLALRPPPDPANRELTREELLFFTEQ